ncbi:MAG: glycosyl transferase family 1, partial [Alphaproteobacteria bacterium]|nr:glycosyl transferase family 1 [Alphaproteobacteria bacterium]
MKNRLFIFAGYSNTGTVSDSLLYYIKSLSKLGDIVLYMDSDISKKELSKISKYCLFVSAKRHGEYDFGSYKRGYLYAAKHGLFNKYSWIYFVN